MVHDAFLQRGFSRVWSSNTHHYRGLLDPTGLKVPANVHLSDFDFVTPPIIRLSDVSVDSVRQLPHVLRSDGSLCYLDAKAIVLDRYDPGGTILQCLEQADKVLRDAVRGRLDEDLVGEFAAYWAEGSVLVDLAAGFEGDAQIQALRLKKQMDHVILVSNGNSQFLRLHRSNDPDDPDPERKPCVVVRVPSLAFDPKQSWPPKDLAALNAWLKGAAPTAVGKVEEAFSRTEGHTQWICLSAPNGRFFVSAELGPAYRKPEFLTNRRGHLGQTLRHIQGSVEISGYVGIPVDEHYIFSRNMGCMKNLSGKRILLIGCGTIGGFLAQQLAQSGAGSAGGKLTLVDNDTLQGANVGRHLLGAPYLTRNKAEGCSEFLREQLPHLDIAAHTSSIVDVLSTLDRHDLVIDATGEEALSIALNERAVQQRPTFPPLMFVWLEGNGAAAISTLTGDPNFCCYKCLKPQLAGPGRFRILRPETEVETGRNLACGDAFYIPFPVSRAVAAASLACDMTLDWVNGGGGFKWRCLTLDHRRAYQAKDSNPRKLDACPACGGSK